MEKKVVYTKLNNEETLNLLVKIVAERESANVWVKNRNRPITLNMYYERNQILFNTSGENLEIQIIQQYKENSFYGITVSNKDRIDYTDEIYEIYINRPFTKVKDDFFLLKDVIKIEVF